MSDEFQYSDIVFRRDDVNVLAYRPSGDPKPTITVDFEGLEVTIFASPTDNTLVVQVDTVNKTQLENLRVQVDEIASFRGRVSNVSNPANTNEFTVLFDDGQTNKKEN